MNKIPHILAGVTLLLGSSVCLTSSPAQAATTDPFVNVPDSRTLTTPVAVSGVLTSSSGSALQNASVGITAFGPSGALGTEQDGMELSRSVTDATGAFSLRIPSLFALTSLDDANGLVEFMVYAPDSSQLPHMFTRRLVAGAIGYTLQDPASPPSAQSFGATQATQTLVGGSDQVTDPEFAPIGGPDQIMTGDSFEQDPGSDSGGIQDNSVDPNSGGTTSGCGRTPLKSWSNRLGALGGWYSNLDGVDSQFTYAQGASSSIGIAVSATGKYGSYHLDSKKSQDASKSQGFPLSKNSGGWIYRTYFEESKFHYFCAGRSAGYAIEPTGWDGGTQMTTGLTAPAGITSCVPELKGSTWTQDNSTAVTWTNGLSLSAIIGLDASIGTGYSKDTRIFVNFARAGGRLCGRGDKPGGKPYLLMARKPA